MLFNLIQFMHRLLTSVNALLVEEALENGILTRMKRFFLKGRRDNQVVLMHEELLDVLRDIEVSGDPLFCYKHSIF
jgi:hypothetical protein